MAPRSLTSSLMTHDLPVLQSVPVHRVKVPMTNWIDPVFAMLIGTQVPAMPLTPCEPSGSAKFGAESTRPEADDVGMGMGMGIGIGIGIGIGMGIGVASGGTLSWPRAAPLGNS